MNPPNVTDSPLAPLVTQSRNMEPVANPENRSISGLTGMFRNLSSRLNRGPPSAASTTSLTLPTAQSSRAPSVIEPYFSPEIEHYEILQQILPGNSTADRTAAAELLRRVVRDYELTDIMGIWSATKDLTTATMPAETRRAAFDLLTACIEHSEPTPLEQMEFFDTLTAPMNDEDFQLQLRGLKELSGQGKNITAFETRILPTLLAWLQKWFKAAAVERAVRRQKHLSSAESSDQEKNLTMLFDFIVQVVKFNFKSFREESIVEMLKEILNICKRTTSKVDLEHAITFIDTIITYGYVPRSQLLECLEILCGVINRIKDETHERLSWTAVLHLCKSHMAQNTVLGLFDILQDPVDTTGRPKRNSNTVRGAIQLTQRIFNCNGEDGLPLISFSNLMAAYQKCMAADNVRVSVDLTLAIASFLNNQDLLPLLATEDWTIPLEILVAASRMTVETADGARLDSRISLSPVPQVKDDRLRPDQQLSQALVKAIALMEALLNSPEFVQTELVIDFYVQVHPHLPDSCAERVIRYYGDEFLCLPSNDEWQTNVRHLVEVFLQSLARPADVRLRVITLMREVYETVKEVSETKILTEFIMTVLGKINKENDAQVMEALVMFAVDVAETAEMDLFNKILTLFVMAIVANRTPPSPPTSRPGTASISSQTPSSGSTALNGASLTDAVARGIVRLFIRCFMVSGAKTVRCYEELHKIAGSDSNDVEARVTAMKLLFRIRCDSDFAIMLVESTDSEAVAAALGRTPESAGRVSADEYPRAGRSTSVGPVQTYLTRPSARPTPSIRHLRARTPIWSAPDPHPLPEPLPISSSPYLYAFADPNPAPVDPQARRPPEKAVLKVSHWLEVIIDVLQRPTDWETYSYVLVYLGSQLCNQALFAGCIPTIKLLRSALVQQIMDSSYHEPPPMTNLKRNDVAVCLFHSLSILVSYHAHFARNEQENIVQAFVAGLGWGGERTSKSCVHALTICCYELRTTISKNLLAILTQMGKIVTKPMVAIHVLEFLSCLVRMPELYANFREDDFRVVFGICFRYLQSVRDPARDVSIRTSYGSGRHGPRDVESPTPSSGDDLPQYVLALAYNVLTFWFLALKMNDRPKQVAWLTKNLLEHNGREVLDEQSEVSIDLMQRVCFTESDGTLPSPNFASEADGKVTAKSWIVGSSILTIETASGTGVSQITRRQPSGTSYFIVRPNIGESREDSENPLKLNFMPSHIMLQLTTFSSKSDARPIPMPDDETTTRSLRFFDHIPCVDGHKVGVIYMGEGQTTEQEILANVMGSNDYTEFVEGLGTLTKLQGATFNTQGLDRVSNTDGEFTYCWRDKVTEIVYHITTMMPTDTEIDPQCSKKKSHTGNDFVNIIFNNSGRPFKFDTFPSDFNYVNIVITPASRISFISTRARPSEDPKTSFYRVQLMSRPGFPHISPAAEIKMVSGVALPSFVRNLALNASVFCHVWANRAGGEHISSWRNRLREIYRLRDKHGGPMSLPPPLHGHANGHANGHAVGGSNGGNGGSGADGRSTYAPSPAFNSSMSVASNSPMQHPRDRRISSATLISEQSARSSTLNDADSIHGSDVDSIIEHFDFSKYSM